MEIQSVALGTWFPRTTLHLDEIEAALRGERLPHHPKDLPSLLKKVGAAQVALEAGAFRTLRAHARDGIGISLTEDGILLLETTDETLAAARTKLTRFYEDALGPAMASLFRRGMPLPAELTRVRAALPFFVMATGGTLAEARALAKGGPGPRIGGRAAAATLAQLTLLPGRSVTVLHLPEPAAERSLPLPLEEIMRYLTFVREFEDKLHAYLRLHRDVWETVNAVRNARRLHYRDLTGIRERLDAQRRTVGFVRSRLGQMGDVLAARSQYVRDEHHDLALDALRANRFRSLDGARAYVSHLWEATDRYAGETETLLKLVYDENLRREVVVLNVIVFATLLTQYFSMNVPFPWERAWPRDWPATLLVTVLILGIGVGAAFLLHNLVLNRTFRLKELERGKPVRK